MKRSEIVIGTEYAATGRLAYGNEPRVRARRVRFTSLTPATMVRTLVKSEGYFADGDRILDTAFGPVSATPQPQYATRRQVEVGETYKVVTWVQGGLPAETWNGERWVAGLVAPAEVHRTWAEHSTSVEARKAERAARAPERTALALAQALAVALEVEGVDDKTAAIEYLEGLLAAMGQ